MTMEPGGRAEKLGNENERLWGVQVLLLVLAGEATSVLSEALGPDESGIDFWVRKPDGTRQCQQCKRENAAHGRWSIAELHRVRVFEHARAQLARDAAHRYAFVSSDAAPHLEDLCERTGRSNGDPSLFGAHLTTTSEDLREAFVDLCSYLGWNPDAPADVAQAFDFLARVERLPFPRGRQARVVVERLARTLVRGLPEQVVSDLEALLLTRGMGNELFADHIRNWLTERGHHLLDLPGNPEVHAGVERLQKRFLRSVGGMLIQDSLIQRAESHSLFEAVTRVDAPVRLAIVHGRAGGGKSGALFELAQKLSSIQVPHLFLRLDTQSPRVSTDRFGTETLGLPASPVACLHAVSGGRPAVLVLDQIDAIRWTSSHSADAWDVCEELVEEARATPNIRVVVVCRSFDVSDDPRIAAWKARKGTFVLELSQLLEGDVKGVVERAGRAWNDLSAALRQILATPQSLYLWWQLVRDGADTRGVTRITDLLRAFWKNRRARLVEMGVPPDTQQRVLGSVVGFMDSTGELSAPASIVGPVARELDAYKTLDLIRDEGTRIAFTHQSHLDYLIAENLLQRSLVQPGTIGQWLVGKSQSLFRRPRLQQVLMLLREDDPRVFATVVRELVQRDDVRFHFKVLALRVLGAIRAPTRHEIELVLQLLDLPEWFDHINELVFWKSAEWVRALHAAGMLVEWLRAGPDGRRNRAAWLLRGVNEQVGDVICSVAAAVDDSIRTRWVAAVLPYSGVADSDEVFALRLALLNEGISVVELIAWDKLTQAFPERAIRLLHAYLAALFNRDLPLEAVRNHRRLLMRGEGGALVTAGRGMPSLSVELLWPLCEALTLRTNPSLDGNRSERDRALDGLASDVLALLVPIAGGAAAELARIEPASFMRFVAERGAPPPEALRLPLVRAFASIPSAHADEAMTWLVGDPARLRPGDDDPNDLPARDVLAAHSATCTRAVYARVESAVLLHVDPEERDGFVYGLRFGYQNELGRVQLALLRSLPKDRLSQAGKARLQLWEAKFIDSPPPSPRRGSSFGRVESPIPPARLLHVSDDEWLNIMRREWPERAWHREASVRQFTSALVEATHAEPDRFGRLALRIPGGAAPAYLNAILDGLERRNPPERSLGQERPWKSASHAVLEGVLERVGYCEDRFRADRYLGLVEAHSTHPWSTRVLETVDRYARQHPVPIAGSEPPEAFPTKDTVLQNLASIGTRGRVARAMRQLIAHDIERRRALAHGIDALVSDASIPVRMEAVGICTVLLRADRDDAVQRFLVACQIWDDRVLLPRSYLNEFLGRAMKTHHRSFVPLIRRMVASAHEEVAENGAAWALVVWLDYGLLEDVLAACTAGSVPQRRGLATVLAREGRHEKPAARVIESLEAMFQDPDASVRQEAGSVFWSEDDVFGLPHIAALADRFVRSTAFRDRAAQFVRELKEHTGSILKYSDVVLEACRVYAGPLAESSRDIGTDVAGATQDLVMLLLRVYEQAGDANRPDLENACLDVVDAMLRNRVGLMSSVVDELDTA